MVIKKFFVILFIFSVLTFAADKSIYPFTIVFNAAEGSNKEENYYIDIKPFKNIAQLRKDLSEKLNTDIKTISIKSNDNKILPDNVSGQNFKSAIQKGATIEINIPKLILEPISNK